MRSLVLHCLWSFERALRENFILRALVVHPFNLRCCIIPRVKPLVKLCRHCVVAFVTERDVVRESFEHVRSPEMRLDVVCGLGLETTDVTLWVFF